MASVEFKNNTQSTVADNPLTVGATTLNIATGEGAKFPSAFPFKITLWDASMYPNPGNDSGMEIVKCTARTTDALTIARAQEGTTGVEHSNGERVAMLITAGHFNDAVTGIITKLDTVETNAKDDQIASEVPNTPAGNIAATDAQAAINELDTEKVAIAGDTMTGDLNQGGNYLTNSASINALNAKGAGYWFNNNNIDCGNDDTINVTDNDYTCAVKIRCVPQTVVAHIVYKQNSPWKYFSIRILVDGRIEVHNYDGTNQCVVHSIASMDDNKNHILIVIVSSNTVILYADGIMSSTVNTCNMFTTSSTFRIGNSYETAGSNPLINGSIFEVLFISRVLSATEAKAFSSGAPIDFADIGADNVLIVPSDDCADDDTANWTDVNGALTFDTDHYVYTVATGASVASFTDEAALTVGKRYRATVLVKDGTGAGSTVRINALTNADVVIENGTSITVDGTYATAYVEWIATETNNKVQVEIIAGSVSDGETILFDDIETNQIGCVLQLEQDGIGHNQWLDKSGNENHGAVSGAMPTNLKCNHIEKYRQIVAMTDDTAWTNIVPAGYELEKIIFVESAGNAATLDLGKTSGASDVFSQVVIAASDITTKTIDETFSMSAAQSLYLNDDGVGTWNSASVTATLFMRRVEL